MEITVKPKDGPASYPWLGVAGNGDVVLFAAYGVGTRLRAGAFTLGQAIQHSTAWCMQNFKPFDGEVKVTN